MFKKLREVFWDIYLHESFPKSLSPEQVIDIVSYRCDQGIIDSIVKRKWEKFINEKIKVLYNDEDHGVEVIYPKGCEESEIALEVEEKTKEMGLKITPEEWSNSQWTQAWEDDKEEQLNINF